jgi:hypothetical protein
MRHIRLVSRSRFTRALREAAARDRRIVLLTPDDIVRRPTTDGATAR